LWHLAGEAESPHNLRSLQEMMDIPITMIGIDEEIKYQSENWSEIESDTTLVVDYNLPDENNNPALRIQALEDLNTMYTDIRETEIMVATVFIFVFGIGLALAIFTVNRLVFSPMQKIEHNLTEVANGNLLVEVSSNDKIKEIKSINAGLQYVTNNLSQKLLDISNIGNNLKGSSQDLSSQEKEKKGSEPLIFPTRLSLYAPITQPTCSSIYWH